MPPIVILPIALLQAAAPPVLTVPPPPAPPVYAPPPTPPSPMPSQRREAKAPTPRGSPASWITPNDYPSRALREEQEGTTAFRVIVNGIGRVIYCEVMSSSGWPSLDDATCRLIFRRARFISATNSRGDPVEGAWSSAVRWQIPKDSEVLRVGTTGRQFEVNADGTLSKCRQWDAGAVAPGYQFTCNAAQFYEPLRDKRGAPAARQITITTTTSIADAE